MAADLPEAQQSGDNAQAQLSLVDLDDPVQRCAQVVMLALEAIVPAVAVRPQQLRLGLFRQRQECHSVAPLDEPGLGGLLEALQGVLADGRQHPEARVGVIRAVHPEQALLGQGEESVKDVAAEVLRRTADGLDLRERRASRDDREPLEQASVRRVQQVVAPGDGAAQGLLAGRPVPWAAREHGKGVVEPGPERLHGEHPQACCGQLDGQGQTVKTGDDVGDGRCVGIVHCEVRAHREGTLDEEADRLEAHGRRGVRADVPRRQGERRDG
ncbi:hypothetical protein BH24CHL9_BH24CHL9_03660 [soil metagenome]